MGGMVSVGSYVQVTTKREISLQPSQLEMLMSLLHLLGLISAWCWGCGGLLPRAAVLQGGTCNQVHGCGLPQDALAESLQYSVVHEVSSAAAVAAAAAAAVWWFPYPSRN